MHIGTIPIPAGAALAPMAGSTDKTMRAICARYGAAFTVSEMVSAKALTMNDRKSFRLLEGRGGDAIYGAQLFGQEPDVLAEAVRMLDDTRPDAFDFLDLNLGCPASKIVGHGAGSGLLRDPQKAEAFVQAATAVSKRPVTAKMRIGWSDKDFQGLEVAKRCEAAGAALLAVHGRTRAQMYTPGVNYDAVAAIKGAVSIPVLYNGDVNSAEGALAAMEQTGCDGVMIGRAALGNPFLFLQVAAALNGEAPPAPPSLRERLSVMEEQIRGMCEEKGEEVAMRQARGVAGAYVHGLRGAAALRREAHSLTYFSDVAVLIGHILEAGHREDEAG